MSSGTVSSTGPDLMHNCRSGGSGGTSDLQSSVQTSGNNLSPQRTAMSVFSLGLQTICNGQQLLYLQTFPATKLDPIYCTSFHPTAHSLESFLERAQPGLIFSRDQMSLLRQCNLFVQRQGVHMTINFCHLVKDKEYHYKTEDCFRGTWLI